VAYYAEAKIVGMVPRAVFVPVPKVDSALVELVRRDTPPVDVPSRERLFQLVRAGFAHRRKMLRRTLRAVLGEQTESALTDAGIDPSARPESLSLDEWAALARAEAAS
jgi:16S rRNA (adenine1518-N6/adenine1519-N6)-dimethyltransferase